MARPAKNKLSKHLLEMKFMKRTALRIETQAHEIEQQQQIDEEHWALDVPELKQKQSEFLIEPSSVWCENLKFGRMAFKGFNYEIEKLMKSVDTEQELDMAEMREKEISVSDSEMASRYASLVGTIGKKFSRKRKRKESSDEEEDDDDDSDDICEIKANVSAALAEIRREGESEVQTMDNNTSVSSQKQTLQQLDSGSSTQSMSFNQKQMSNIVNLDNSVVELNLEDESNRKKVNQPVENVNVSPVCTGKPSKAKSSVLEYYSKRKKNKSKTGFIKPNDD